MRGKSKYHKIFIGITSLFIPSTIFASSANNSHTFKNVEILPLSKDDLKKYDYNPKEYWIKGTNIVNNFSIEDAQKFYINLYETITKNFVKPISYNEITNKIFEGLSSFVGKLTIDTTNNRILIYDKDLKLLGNFKKTSEEDTENWVNILINTILNLRQNNKKIADVHQEQIYYVTTIYLLKSLDENSNYTNPTSNKQKQEDKNSTSLGFNYRKTTFGLQVLSILKNSPTYFSNIKTGDIITHINQVPTRSLTDEQLEYILTNTNTDILHINYVPYISNKPTEVFIRKNQIIIPSSTSKKINDIGIITIHNFKDNSSKEIKTSFDNINQNLKGLIIDLRGNINGTPIEAIETANLFINGGEILKTKGQKEEQNKTYTAKDGDIANNIPIVIIANNTTKGTSELFSSIMEGRNRAVIIGTPTFGNGNISEKYTLPNNSEISFATQKAFNAKNISFDKIGIVPIICTSNIFDEKDIKELKQNIKENKFKDNRPKDNNQTIDIINNIRNSCKALYPTQGQDEFLLKIATNIIEDTDIYNKLLNQ